jgi:nucleoside-diphosphate-sugar epimerase
MGDSSADPVKEFRRTNVEGTLNLARQAAVAGVRRFVYISSIKVNGEATPLDRPFRATDHAAPVDPYAVSKHEAELALQQLAADSALQVVVIRPPLVYGPNVRANFRSMMGWLLRGLPLPLGAINNKRSLVGLDNLCDLIATCAEHPAAAGQTFLASDGEDVSTTELLRRLGLALGRPARLLPVPGRLLQAGLAALGRPDIGQRLCSSLQVDIAATRETLGWSPAVSLAEGLSRTAKTYLSESGRHGVDVC